MRPYALALSAKEEVGVEFISGDWTALGGLNDRNFSHLNLKGTLL